MKVYVVMITLYYFGDETDTSVYRVYQTKEKAEEFVRLMMLLPRGPYSPTYKVEESEIIE